jgi:hypothetical protein
LASRRANCTPRPDVISAVACAELAASDERIMTPASVHTPCDVRLSMRAMISTSPVTAWEMKWNWSVVPP